MSRQILLPEGAPRPVSYYSHGIRVGPVLYSAGQTARDASGRLVGPGNVHQQAERAFYNLSLVLHQAGMRFDDVARLNIFARNRADLPLIMKVKERFFTRQAPAMTFAIVEGLAYPEYLLEVEAIAVLDQREAMEK